MAKVLLYNLPQKATGSFIEAWGKSDDMKIIYAEDPVTLLKLLADEMPEVVITGEVDVESFEKIRSASIDSVFIIALNEFKPQNAYRFMKLGAFDCIAPPYDAGEWYSVVNYAAHRKGEQGYVVFRKRKGIDIKILKKAGIYAACVFLISVVLSLIYTHKLNKLLKSESKLPQSFILPVTPSGVFKDAQGFILSDWVNQSVVFCDNDLNLKTIHRFDALQVIQLVKADQYYTVATDGSIRTHKELSDRGIVNFRVDMPAGIAYSNGRVYVADIVSKKLYEISGDSVSSYRLKYTPFGVASSGGRVFIGESETKTILEYPSYKRYYLASYLGKLPAGFCAFEKYFYFIFENSNKMYKIYYGD